MAQGADPGEASRPLGYSAGWNLGEEAGQDIGDGAGCRVGQQRAADGLGPSLTLRLMKKHIHRPSLRDDVDNLGGPHWWSQHLRAAGGPPCVAASTAPDQLQVSCLSGKTGPGHPRFARRLPGMTCLRGNMLLGAAHRHVPSRGGPCPPQGLSTRQPLSSSACSARCLLTV